MAFTRNPLEWTPEGIEPPAELKTEGWLPGHKPPASYFNYKWHNDYLLQQEVQQKLGSVEDEIVLKANIDSPTFTGLPLAPTPPQSSYSREIATTAFVKDYVTELNFDSLGKTQYVTNVDFDELTTDGTYICVGTMTNTPTPNTFCYAQVYDTPSTSQVLQFCYVPVGWGLNMYMRHNRTSGSVWTSWQLVNDNSNTAMWEQVKQIWHHVDMVNFETAAHRDASSIGAKMLLTDVFRLNSRRYQSGYGQNWTIEEGSQIEFSTSAVWDGHVMLYDAMGLDTHGYGYYYNPDTAPTASSITSAMYVMQSSPTHVRLEAAIVHTGAEFVTSDQLDGIAVAVSRDNGANWTNIGVRPNFVQGLEPIYEHKPFEGPAGQLVKIKVTLPPGFCLRRIYCILI